MRGDHEHEIVQLRCRPVSCSLLGTGWVAAAAVVLLLLLLLRLLLLLLRLLLLLLLPWSALKVRIAGGWHSEIKLAGGG